MDYDDPVKECGFYPEGFADLHFYLESLRSEEFRQKYRARIWTADVAFLAAGLRNTSHAIPGEGFQFHDSFYRNRGERAHDRLDFNRATKNLLADLVSFVPPD